MKLSRRSLLLGAGLGPSLLDWGRFGQWLSALRGQPAEPPGKILGASWRDGHRVHGAGMPEPTAQRRTRVVIAGAGIAGLTAAWRLDRAGWKDFVVLDLERSAGGNSQSGSHGAMSFPWGAHYLPLPSPESSVARELLREFGVITGTGADGLPIYDELAICAAPQERLRIHGVWQEGLVPSRYVPEPDRAEISAFFDAMKMWQDARGEDGRPAFAIPVDQSSRDPEVLALDALTMLDWLDRQGWRSRYLRWYVDYYCRDEFGTPAAEVSAWAGIHYFASRRGRAANAPPGSVLTWPAGNGWLVDRFTERLGTRVESSKLVVEIGGSGREVWVNYLDLETGKSVRIDCEAVICALPRFVAARVVRALREDPPAYLRSFSYSPWLVANLLVDRIPEGEGAPPAWDNVGFESPSLGYVVSSHQELRQYPRAETVLTYYRPLTALAPEIERQQAIERTFEAWRAMVLDDLESLHPSIRRSVRRIDVWIWGHGMIRPVPGFLWGEARQSASKPVGRVWFAHSDMSGISVFEEAADQGARAADSVVAALVPEGTKERV